MELEIKRPDHIVPSYSLTGDLLSFTRCPLQYRYHNGSALPPSRPVQQWFGEFLHGTLELCFTYWKQGRLQGAPVPDFPWPCTQREWNDDAPAWQENDIGRFGDLVETALRQQGKQARSADARDSAYRRIQLAVNLLGPHLFPLIDSAEKKVIGTRPVPAGGVPVRCSNYEVHGIIDVVTHVTLDQADDGNLIKRFVREACPELRGDFEVIVDYKGSRRPMFDEDYWDQGNWQLQTYAWLRQRQPEAPRVAAGILVYINELTPAGEEMKHLKRGMATQQTDVVPESRADRQIVELWRDGQDADQLSLEFRLRRAIRVVPITDESIRTALAAFDNIVRQAEENIIAEAGHGDIMRAWAPRCSDKGTCDACDFRHFCPSPFGEGDGYVPPTPVAP